MYLKSIEIHGFKSFANKIVFEFQKGITAIVGPNGSGKSNVGDAVRWVLGEQSAKQLRGSKMEDIIFAGTELRKPQGFAYVAITFDNSDHKLPTSYEEVTVARRVYRSGESEYLMNGTNCRLRDVQELFLDTGIGKEGYSIIGQGQIDKILNGKPEERRELFDEAAGIVKYKKRKAQAEKNLEIERQNLCRITDILSELEKQVGPLKEQADTAREYLRLREELKKVDVNLFLTEYDLLHEDVRKVEDNLKIVSGDYEEREKEFEEKKRAYEQLEQELEQKNIILEQNKSIINEKKIHKEQLEGEIKVCREQINAAIQSDSHYKERGQQLLGDIQKKEKEKQQCEKDKEALYDGIENIEQEKKQIEEQLQNCRTDIEGVGKQIDDCNAEIMEYLNKNAVLKGKLEKYTTMLEQSNVKKAELTQRILKSKTEEAICAETLEKEEKKLSDLSIRITNKQKIQKEIIEEQEEERKELAELQQKYSKKQQEFHREKSKLEALRNMTERYDGYGQSIRRIMEQKEKNPGIIGVVADIVKVKKEYEVAIETALGGSIQNIVTDTEETAKDMINFLKKNRFGRATFLPLTAISGRGGLKNPEVLKENGVLGIASSLVNVSEKFSNLAEYLLGRIIVVDHIDHAIAVAKKYRNSLRIVTLEGELLNPGGSMSGGAYKNSSNLLSRRREMEDGELLLDELQHEWNRTKKQIEEIQFNIEKKSKDLKKLQAELQELFLEQNTSKMKYNQAKSESENIAVGYKLIHQESSDVENQFFELKATIDKLQTEMEFCNSENQKKEEEIVAYNKQLEEKKKKEEEYREKAANVSIAFSSVEQKKEFLDLNKKRIESEITSLQEEYSKLQENMKNVALQVQEKEEKIAQIKEKLQGEEQQVGELTQYVKTLMEDKEATSKRHKEILGDREKISELIGNLDKEIFRLKNQKEKLSEQIDSKMDYMWEEYELTYNLALELKQDLGLEHVAMKKQVTELKSKMKGLGDVNVNAIEDYRNISERYEHLHGQHEDLIHSEEVLQGIVEELDVEMRKQFEEKFAQIKKQFDVVFRELFGGGKGTIELAEDEDVLEAGITIVAQPPGKKLQNMMQMSGGEKALTAISLLFAIQSLKPSPFCLLDEIEAALDDSNVKRYAQYLHKLTKDTQFIVITHRRGTMAAADILYGITMQEKGVSTMVSVNLIEDELSEMEKQHS